ncbi:hypothetical protein [Vibrio phage vB_VmeM-Yong XC32]|nr:hypothetical protein [Vibrio phage vB_VmeM-Yong XC31]QAX96328.1 hypothetical protein [Vibrio phage vB_VmeM-Yong XC32]QAX96646.1 hypothetical protein [Vibrio phage vB_VmeM-Yong MS31]QAX96964.1 hypothetical protein [Vibrio phage vB_VmeM-Yong MS32]
MKDFRKSIIASAVNAPAGQPKTVVGSKDEVTPGLTAINVDDIELHDIEITEAEVTASVYESVQADYLALAESVRHIEAFIEAKGDSMTREDAAYAMTLYDNATVNLEGIRQAYELPSMEGVDEVEAVRLEVEAAGKTVKETIVQVGKVLLKAIEAIIAAGVKFYDEHLSQVARLEKSIDKLHGINPTGKPKEKSLKVPQVEYLYAKGKLFTGSMRTYTDRYSKASKLILSAIRELEGHIEKADETNLVETNNRIKESTNQLNKAFVSGFAATKSISEKDGAKLGLGKGAKSYVSTEELPGGKAIYFSVPAENSERALNVHFGDALGAKEAPEAITDVSAGDAKAFAKRAYEGIAAYRQANESGKAVLHFCEYLIKAINKALTNLKDAEFAGAPFDEFFNRLEQLKQYTTTIRDAYQGVAKWSALHAAACAGASKAVMKNLEK